MKTLNLQQGSPDWLAHRRTTRNASDASVMMGAFPTFSRREFVKLTATGLEREHSDYVQRFVLDRGHEVEPALRALAEKIVGEDLYPVTGVSNDGYLGASFDGVTLDEGAIFEAKQSSVDKIAMVEQNEVPPQDYWQIVQQFAVCESAQTCIYIVGDGTEANTRYMKIPRRRIEADIPKLLAGWRQFEADVAAYTPEPAAASAAVGRAPDQLPALRIELTGMVTASNLAEFKAHAMAVLGSINRDLQTDEDFADAEQTVKWCKAAEDRLQAAKDHALAQTASIDELFRTIDNVSAETRKIRLELDKLVTREKESRKAEIVAAARASVQAHYDGINATMGAHALAVPATLTALIGSAIKGKRTLATIRDAADSAAAQAKIDASQIADRTRACMAVLDEHKDRAHLFADRVQLCATKQPEDLRNLVAARIAEHEQRETARLEAERERIRQEEADRLERERAEKAAADSSHGIATSGGVSDSGEIPDRDAAGSDGGCSPGGHGTAGHVQGGGTRGADGLATAAAASPMPTAQFKLGDLNAWLAPLSISAAGLASLGFKPVGNRGAAQLYAGEDFPRICSALMQLIADAHERAAQKQAA
jgi:predicted phage-related endonuclease